MRQTSRTGKALASLMIFLLAACATAPTPEYVAENLNAEAVGQLYILPIVDHRIDQSKNLKLDKKLYAKRISKRVKKARYDFTMEKNRATISSVTRDALEDMEPEMITNLGPAGSRWVLLLVLHDSDSKLTFGSTASAEVTGFLIDKDTHAVLWQNKELGETAHGGLFGVMVKGMMQEEAVVFALDKVLKGLPRREKS